MIDPCDFWHITWKEFKEWSDTAETRFHPIPGPLYEQAFPALTLKKTEKKELN